MTARLVRSKSGSWAGILALCAGLWPRMAAACPICNTETGRQVRLGIFNDSFWSTLLAVVSPFPVLLLAIAAYRFGWPPLRDRSASTSHANLSHQTQ